MHYNLQHTPIYLDFGVSETHRTHAEEMYEIMLGYNLNMWIDTEPTGSHGFSVMDEEHVCDWFSQFTLTLDPSSVNLKLDNPSRAYWLEAINQIDSLDFISINAEKSLDSLNIYSFENSDTLTLHILNQDIFDYRISSDISINKLGLAGESLVGQEEGSFDFQMIDDAGLELQYTLQNNVIWLEHYGLPPYELPFYGSFSLIFQTTEAQPGDINQDGTCDVIDIILMINHIIEDEILTDDQVELADMNDDGSVDIMDIILVVSIIINS